MANPASTTVKFMCVYSAYKYIYIYTVYSIYIYIQYTVCMYVYMYIYIHMIPSSDREVPPEWDGSIQEGPGRVRGFQPSYQDVCHGGDH